MRKISLAFIIVWIPIVIDFFGTLSSPKKELAASNLVILSKLISLVVDLVPEPGSLKPMCPVLPIPRICMSIPPTSTIFYSYLRQKSTTSSGLILPSGILIFSGLILI